MERLFNINKKTRPPLQEQNIVNKKRERYVALKMTLTMINLLVTDVGNI